MIKANELRVGNWVNVINAVPIQITAGHIKSIAEGDNDYSPIPLTPEILQRAKFEFDGDYTFRKGRFHVYQAANWTGFCFCESNLILREIKDVDELQNLYFALTGQELDIQLLNSGTGSGSVDSNRIK